MKPRRHTTPERRALFDERLVRIQQVTGCRTQMQLAEYIGVRQSSISDAKRRGSIPGEWLLTIWRATGTNPDWILHGDDEPRFANVSHKYGEPLNVTELRQRIEKEIRDELDNLHAEDLIHRLEDMGLAVSVTPKASNRKAA